MLRRALLWIATLLAMGGLVLLVAGVPAPGVPFLLAGGVLLLALVFERWRYRSEPAADGGRWHRTEERFEDPESGQIMEVQFDPATGQRRYVRVDQRSPGPEPR
jgi:uncharacterized protein (DUF58 family)